MVDTGEKIDPHGNAAQQTHSGDLVMRPHSLSVRYDMLKLIILFSPAQQAMTDVHHS